MTNSKRLSLIAICAMLFIAACGNKGDLYLPEKASDDAKTEVQKTKK
jgi:predicted small lipoprotein YifL